MANSDYTIADQTGASFLTDINGQLAAIQTNNSKATAPVAADGVAVGMLWYNSAGTTQSGIPAGTVGVCTAVNAGVGTWATVGNTDAAINTLIAAGITGKQNTLSSSATVPTNAVVQGSIADNAVGLAELAGIARGSVIVGNSSGNPAVVNGSTDQVLSTNSSGDAVWADAAAGSGTLLNRTTAGTSTFVIPSGVTTIYLTAIGGGGSGGYGRADTDSGGGQGGGGGSGAYTVNHPVTVTAGATYTWVVGAGGVDSNSGSTNDGTTGFATTLSGTGVSITLGGGTRWTRSNWWSY